MIWIEAGHLEQIDNSNDEHNHSEKEYKSAWEKLKSADGVVVPGGFGNRYDTWTKKNFVYIQCNSWQYLNDSRFFH